MKQVIILLVSLYLITLVYSFMLDDEDGIYFRGKQRHKKLLNEGENEKVCLPNGEICKSNDDCCHGKCIKELECLPRNGLCISLMYNKRCK